MSAGEKGDPDKSGLRFAQQKFGMGRDSPALLKTMLLCVTGGSSAGELGAFQAVGRRCGRSPPEADLRQQRPYNCFQQSGTVPSFLEDVWDEGRSST